MWPLMALINVVFGYALSAGAREKIKLESAPILTLSGAHFLNIL